MADYLQQANQLVKGGLRGATSDLVGAPVDILNLLLKALDTTKVLPQKFATEEPVMGSNWIHRRLQDAGMASEPTKTPTENMGRVLGAFAVTPANIARSGVAAENAAKTVGADIDRRLYQYLDETGQMPHAVKDPGGMWHPEAGERLASPIKQKLSRSGLGPEELALPDTEISRGGYRPSEIPERIAEVHADRTTMAWTDRAIRNYLNKYAGTSRDPLKDVEVPFGNRTKRWEELFDAQVMRRPATDIDPRAKPDEIAYDLVRGARRDDGQIPPGARDIRAYGESAIQSYLSHVGDFLRQNVAPARLAQYDLTRAVRETAANDARVAKEMERSAQASMKDLPVHKEYPDGMRWVELKKPDALTEGQRSGVRETTRQELDRQPGLDAIKDNYVALDSAGKPIVSSYSGNAAGGKTPEEAYLAGRLAEEGNQMGHCVGGYCETVASGESRIFSLRDAKGKSHVTVEVNPPSRDYIEQQARRYINTPEGQQRWDSFRNQGKDSVQFWDEIKAETEAKLLSQITQIKGKQNRAPVAEYLPYVQDFVKGGKWGEVGDLQNTGLVRTPQGYMTAEEAKANNLLQGDPRY